MLMAPGKEANLTIRIEMSKSRYRFFLVIFYPIGTIVDDTSVVLWSNSTVSFNAHNYLLTQKH